MSSRDKAASRLSSSTPSAAEDDETSELPPQGPITQQLNYRQYLADNKVPEMFQSLIASLMMERPTDMFSYLDTKLEAIKEVGLENIDWETFVYPLHPSRDPVRMQFVKEKEEGKDNDLPFDSGYGGAKGCEVAEDSAKGPESNEASGSYKPDVFQLTEPEEDE